MAVDPVWIRFPMLRTASPAGVLRRTVACVVLAAAMLAPLLVVAVVDAAPASASTRVLLTVDEQAHLDLLNARRRQQGLPDLVVEAAAQRDARAWARYLSDRGSIAHDPGLGSACARAAASSCTGWAENVGQGYSQRQVFDLFVGSSGHAANMALGRSPAGQTYRVGIGVITTGGRTYVVHRFYACDCANDGLAAALNQQHREARAFVTELLRDFLGRNGTSAEIGALAAPLSYGEDRRAAATALAYSDSWVGALIDGYYESTLGRSPDSSGRRFWIDAVRSGQTPAQVASYFYASPEYYQRSGGTDPAWVTDLYREILGRSPDAAGLRAWVATARRDGRTAVAGAFYQSAESRTRRVVALYSLLLGRRPDSAGLRYWRAQLLDGRDVRLAIDLAGSDEYLARAVRLNG